MYRTFVDESDDEVDPPPSERWRRLFQPRNEPKLVTILASYFDDSGTNRGSDVCVTAGFRASDRNWGLFEARWVAALPTECKNDFHAEEFFRRCAAGEEAQPLLQAILDSDVWPIVAAIDVKAFNECTEPERTFLTGGYWSGRKMTWTGITGSPNTPFHVPFQYVVYRALDLTSPGKRMNFVFDRQTVLHGYMKELYNRWKGWADDPGFVAKMGTFAEEPRVDNPPLQAADMLAYCTYQFRLHNLFDRPLTPQVAACSEKLQAMRHGPGADDPDFMMIDRARIQNLLNTLPESIRDGSADKRKSSR